MSYSNQTTHYGLPLPTGSDKSTFLDTNEAFTDVDTALYQAVTGISGVEQEVQDLNSNLTTLSGTVTEQATEIGALQNGLASTNLLVQSNTSRISDLENNQSRVVGTSTATTLGAALLELKNSYLNLPEELKKRTAIRWENILFIKGISTTNYDMQYFATAFFSSDSISVRRFAINSANNTSAATIRYFNNGSLVESDETNVSIQSGDLELIIL